MIAMVQLIVEPEPDERENRKKSEVKKTTGAAVKRKVDLPPRDSKERFLRQKKK